MPPQVNSAPSSAYQPMPIMPPAAVPPLTMGKFKASKTIVLESWAILRQDKEMMWFPVLSALVSIVALIIFCALYFVFAYDSTAATTPTMQGYVLLFLYYFMMFFITNFFQAGLFIIAHARFSGQNLSFTDGINGAMAKSGKIVVWSAISASVGVILQMIADRSKFIGKMVAWLLGAAWNILTYFSLPSLVIGNTSITNSFKESAAVIRKTWGETIIVQLGVGLFFSLLIFSGLVLSIGVVVLIPDVVVAIGVGALLLVYVIVLTVISSTLSSIFKLALYEYATTGKVPSGFSPALIQNAIKTK